MTLFERLAAHATSRPQRPALAWPGGELNYAGLVDAVDATGKRLEFEITPLPILPGQTRRVPLFQPVIDDREPGPFKPPLELKGTIEWDGGSERFTRRAE